MAEEHDPRIANELVEVDGAVRSLCIKVWSSVAQSKWSSALFGTHIADGGLKLTDLKAWLLRSWRGRLIARRRNFEGAFKRKRRASGVEGHSLLYHNTLILAPALSPREPVKRKSVRVIIKRP